MQIPLPLVLKLAAPYLAGETPEEAVQAARKEFELYKFSSNIDVLGENSTSPEQCEVMVEHYKHLIDILAATRLNTSETRRDLTISLKPSMFSTAEPKSDNSSKKQLDAAFERIGNVAEYAFKHSIGLTIEAENHSWTNFQLECYFALIHAGYSNLGTVLQSRLLRTEKDVVRFDERMRVRLVIGIYNEPSNIAITRKPLMKKALVSYAGALAAQGAYVEVATHDAKCLHQFFNEVVIPQRLSPTRFETQFLYGVPRKKLQLDLISGKYFHDWQKESGNTNILEQLIAEGVLVRLYLPYGTKSVAGPYCRRRLRENPNIIVFGIKNMLHIQ
jgi:proline dehydrogenase